MSHCCSISEGAFMRISLAIGIIMIWGTAQAVTPGAGRFPAPFHPLAWGLYGSAAVQNAISQSQDTLGDIDINSPNYRYPGKAMILSLAVPGAGQLYVGQPKRTVLFLGVEIAAGLAWYSYSRQGEEATLAFKDTADAYWNFWHWLETAPFYLTDPWGTGDGQIYVGPGTSTHGTHHLEFYVDTDDDGSPEFYNTSKHARVLDPYIDDPTTRDSVDILMTNEYYENIGKYNQFFSGWEDADPDTNKNGIRIEERTSGLIALTPHRSKYLHMRGDANRLKSVASYAISALMFNHVISAIDAIFATSRWNREHASRLSGRLWFNPAYSRGVSGVQLSLTW